MALAPEKTLAKDAWGPSPPAGHQGQQRTCTVTVVFTTAFATIAALRRAGAYASSLFPQVTLIVPQIVPYWLPLERPPVLMDFNERRFAELAEECPVETVVRIYLCRDRFTALKTMLPPRSLVVIGCRKRRWWPSAETLLGRRLRRLGHEVIFIGTE
jgi:hypothetical protein